MIILQNAAVIALVVLFVQAMTWEDMILQKLGDAIEDHFPSWIYKPLIGCPICMSPWWGTLIIWISSILKVPGFEWMFHREPWDGRTSFIQWILTLGVAGGLSVFSVMAIKRYHLNSTMLDDLEGIE